MRSNEKVFAFRINQETLDELLEVLKQSKGFKINLATFFRWAAEDYIARAKQGGLNETKTSCERND